MGFFGFTLGGVSIPLATVHISTNSIILIRVLCFAVYSVRPPALSDPCGSTIEHTHAAQKPHSPRHKALDSFLSGVNLPMFAALYRVRDRLSCHTFLITPGLLALVTPAPEPGPSMTKGDKGGVTKEA